MWFIVFIFLLCANLYAQDKKSSQQEPPPPPIPFSEIYKRDIDQTQQQKIEEVTDLFEIPEPVIRDFIQKRDKLLPYLRDYKNLKIQPFKQQYLSMTNIFYYTPSVPVLMLMPFKIKHVIMTNPGGTQISGQGRQQQDSVHSVFEDRYLIVFPPPPSTDIWSFVVVSEDNQPYYFFGERATTSMTKSKHVIPFISYIYQPNYDERKLILAYYQQYKRCPYHGETIEINGHLYRIVIKDTKLMSSDNYVYFCDRIYEVIKVQ